MPMPTDDMVTAIFKKLDASTLLQGATYLNGTDKIEKQARRRKGMVAPCITMKIGGTSLNTESKVMDATVYINTYVADHANGTANYVKLSSIAVTVEALLEDADLSSYSMYRFFNCYVVSPHGEAYFDPDFPDEHYVTTVIRYQCQGDLGVA